MKDSGYKNRFASKAKAYPSRDYSELLSKPRLLALPGVYVSGNEKHSSLLNNVKIGQ